MLAGKQITDSGAVGDHRISDVDEAGERVLRSLGTASATGVADEDGNEAKIGGVAAGRFDADFERDAAIRKLRMP